MDAGKILFGVGVAGVDVLLWQHFVPNHSDIRTADAYNPDIESAERKALLIGSAFTLIVAGFARSVEVFTIGGGALVMLDFATKHANAVNPQTGKMQPVSSVESTSYPMPDYQS